MKIQIFALTITLCLLTLGTGFAASADSSAFVKKTLTTLYEKRDAAASKKDIKGAVTSFSPDFVYVSKEGQKGDLKTLQQRIFAYISLMKTVKVKSVIQTIVVKGKTAKVTVKDHLDMSITNDKTGKTTKVTADQFSEDQWEKGGKGWLQKRMTVKKEAAMMDGKPITADMMSGSSN